MNNEYENLFWYKYEQQEAFLVTQLKCNRDKDRYTSVYNLFRQTQFVNEPSLNYFNLVLDELEFFIQDSYSYSLWNNDKKIMLKACEHIRDLIHSFQTRYKI